MVRVILFIVLFQLIWWLIRYLLTPSSKGGQRYSDVKSEDSSSRTITGTMVRDPVCGMHVATELAIKDLSTGRPLFFCSQECRRKYLSSGSR